MDEPITCSGRDSVNAIAPRTDELDATAGGDECLEAVGAQVGQQFQHGLVDQFGVGPFEASVPSLRDPLRSDLRELVAVHAGVSHRDQLHQTFFARGGERLHVVVQHRLEWLLVGPGRILRRERLDAVQNEGELDVHRLLDPQRAVIVEGRDALLDRDEVRAALIGGTRDEVDDRFLGRALVPRGQSIALRLRKCCCGT